MIHLAQSPLGQTKDFVGIRAALQYSELVQFDDPQQVVNVYLGDLGEQAVSEPPFGHAVDAYGAYWCADSGTSPVPPVGSLMPPARSFDDHDEEVKAHRPRAWSEADALRRRLMDP